MGQPPRPHLPRATPLPAIACHQHPHQQGAPQPAQGKDGDGQRVEEGEGPRGQPMPIALGPCGVVEGLYVLWGREMGTDWRGERRGGQQHHSQPWGTARGKSQHFATGQGSYHLHEGIRIPVGLCHPLPLLVSSPRPGCSHRAWRSRRIPGG